MVKCFLIRLLFSLQLLRIKAKFAQFGGEVGGALFGGLARGSFFRQACAGIGTGFRYAMLARVWQWRTPKT